MTRNLLIYGDSNSHGTRPMAVQGTFDRFERGVPWPDVMAAAAPDWHVVTEGLPGRTTVHEDRVEGGMRNGLAVLPAVLHSHAPLDGVMILLGTNDLKTRFSVSAYEIARSLVRLVHCVRQSGVTDRVALMAPIPVRELGGLRDAFAGAEARQVGLTGCIADVARAEECAFFDCGLHGAVSDTDGVHWEGDVHAQVGRAAAAFLREVWP